jgi:hypothetical protein
MTKYTVRFNMSTAHWQAHKWTYVWCVINLDWSLVRFQDSIGKCYVNASGFIEAFSRQNRRLCLTNERTAIFLSLTYENFRAIRSTYTVCFTPRVSSVVCRRSSCKTRAILRVVIMVNWTDPCGPCSYVVHADVWPLASGQRRNENT